MVMQCCITVHGGNNYHEQQAVFILFYYLILWFLLFHFVLYTCVLDKNWQMQMPTVNELFFVRGCQGQGFRVSGSFALQRVHYLPVPQLRIVILGALSDYPRYLTTGAERLPTELRWNALELWNSGFEYLAGPMLSISSCFETCCAGQHYRMRGNNDAQGRQYNKWAESSAFDLV